MRLKILKDQKGIDHELVIVGRRDERHSQLLNLLTDQSFIRYLGELSDLELVMLYNLAEVFVLPSYYEGFGLPVCGSYGVRNACDHVQSLKPARSRRNRGSFVEPDQVDALVELLYNILSDQSLRRNLSSNGLRASQTIFMEKNRREQTMAVYNKVLEGDK